MHNNKQLPLRIGVGIILLNHENKVFVGKRIDNPKNYWQMPQGGIDQNENFLQAAKRELEEETGIKSVELVKELSGWFEYDLPEKKEIIAALKSKLASFKTSRIQWIKAAEAADQLSYGDITRVCEDAIKDAIIHNRETVTHTNLIHSIKERCTVSQKQR